MVVRWLMRQMDKVALQDRSYMFLFEPGPDGEYISIDCETTGLDRKRDEIISVAAIRIKGDKILASESFRAIIRPRIAIDPEAIKVHGLREQDVAQAPTMKEVLPDLLHFIGGRPLVGYYIDFDLEMLNKHVAELIGVELPNPVVEVSGIYYDLKYGDAPPGTQVDLKFASILRDLKLPLFNQHDAYSDALMTAMIYVGLRDMKARGVTISRPRFKPKQDYSGG
jgi:DNA polymerase III subunit epsilon